MTVDDWVYEAVEESGKAGASLRQVQRFIDEHHYEELAIDTIENALDKLVASGRLAQDGNRWQVAHKTSREDALKKLFGNGL
jgi:hypothetical protein